MTKQKKFKKRVRARMARTGQSFVTARTQLDAPRSTAPASTSHSESITASAPQEGDWRAAYRARRKRFREESLADWRALIGALTCGRTNAVWTELDEIAVSLNRVAEDAPRNHLHFPDGGGLDLTGADRSREPGCLEIHTQGQVGIVRPRELQVVSTPNDPLGEWAYIRLELDPLRPSGVYENHRPADTHEELAEVNGEYLERGNWDRGFLSVDEDGYEVPLPEDARVVTRYFRGSLLIVAKGSIYNSLPATYDGLHSRIPAELFRQEIADLVANLHATGRYGIDPKAG